MDMIVLMQLIVILTGQHDIGCIYIRGLSVLAMYSTVLESFGLTK
jgi:hypothetical protein